MIKVEHTRLHESAIYASGSDTECIKILVTDAELVLVPNKIPPADVYVNSFGFHPILISRKEKIEVGDWFIDNRTNRIGKCEEVSPNRTYCYKILALPEHFSPQQLQDIIDGKLKGGACLVECTEINVIKLSKELMNQIDSSTSMVGYPIDRKEYQIKLSPHITIYPSPNEDDLTPLSKFMNQQRNDEGERRIQSMNVECQILKMMNESYDPDYTLIIAKKAYNLALEHASEQAFVRWVVNPKMSDPNHETAIVDKQSILDLKI